MKVTILGPVLGGNRNKISKSTRINTSGDWFRLTVTYAFRKYLQWSHVIAIGNYSMFLNRGETWIKIIFYIHEIWKRQALRKKVLVGKLVWKQWELSRHEKEDQN